MRKIFFCLLLIGCAKKDQSVFIVPDEIAPYVTQFEMASRISGQAVIVSNIDIQFVESSELREHEIGVCIRGKKTPKVRINRQAWDDFSPWSRRELIFHELGHCILNKDHTETGLMSPYHMGETGYNATTFLSLDKGLFQ